MVTTFCCGRTGLLGQTQAGADGGHPHSTGMGTKGGFATLHLISNPVRELCTHGVHAPSCACRLSVPSALHTGSSWSPLCPTLSRDPPSVLWVSGVPSPGPGGSPGPVLAAPVSWSQVSGCLSVSSLSLHTCCWTEGCTMSCATHCQPWDTAVNPGVQSQ